MTKAKRTINLKRKTKKYGRLLNVKKNVSNCRVMIGRATIKCHLIAMTIIKLVRSHILVNHFNQYVVSGPTIQCLIFSLKTVESMNDF